MCKGTVGFSRTGAFELGINDTFSDPKGQPEGSTLYLGPRGTPTVNSGRSGGRTKDIQRVKLRGYC
jgi:hypothetical protein